MNELYGWFTVAAAAFAANVLPALLMLIVGLLVIRLVMKIVKKFLEATHLEKAAHTLVKSLVRVALYLLLGLMVADKIGVDVTGVIALASVLTLAVSLSLQNALGNVFGGFSLLYTQPFKSGDYVDVAGKSGTVKEIGMSYTVLATPDNKLISIPNSSVVAGDIVNYTVTGTRRLDIKVRAAYCIPTQKVIDALLQAGTMDNVLMDPAPFAAIDCYGESAIEYVLRVWTKTDDYWDVYYTITQRIKDTFDAQGIKAGYPHMHIITDSQK